VPLAAAQSTHRSCTRSSAKIARGPTTPASWPIGPLKGSGAATDDRCEMSKTSRALLKDESGATAVEYGLIVAAIAGLIIVVVFLLGKKVNNAFSNVASHMP
jgi:pilus assembly protein Flp/PilA